MEATTVAAVNDVLGANTGAGPNGTKLSLFSMNLSGAIVGEK
jgi:hypothetical protein